MSTLKTTRHCLINLYLPIAYMMFHFTSDAVNLSVNFDELRTVFSWEQDSNSLASVRVRRSWLNFSDIRNTCCCWSPGR